MTMKETITQELLDAVDDPGGPEAVFQRHSHSKGPFYAALSAATAQLRDQVVRLQEETAEAETEHRELLTQVESQKECSKGLHATVKDLDRRVDEAEGKLGRNRVLLERADRLTQMGFDETELNCLFNLLGQVAASQGLPLEDGVAQFFETMGQYEKVVSLELEMKRVEAKADRGKAEADRWDTEAKRREAHSKARTSAIDVTERLLAKGVKERDLPLWQKILDKAGVFPERLASSLEELGSFEKLIRTREKRANELQDLIEKAQTRLEALLSNQSEVEEAIDATRDGALRQMETVSRKARQHLDSLLATTRQYGDLQRAYGDLQRQGEQLGSEITLARAFRSMDTQQWMKVPGQTVSNFLAGLVYWADCHDTAAIKPPAGICKEVSWLNLYKLKLSEILIWAYSAVIAQQDAKQESKELATR